MERPNELPVTVSYISDEKPKSFHQRSRSVLCLCCTSFLIPFVVAIVTSYLVNKSFIAATINASINGFGGENVPVLSETSSAERLRAPESLHGTIPWASYNLAQDKFYKGISRIPWTAGESGSSGVSLEDNHRIRIKQSGLYEIYSKITFEFTVDSHMASVYHTVNLNDTENGISVLEKNMISVANNRLRERRTFQISDLFTLRRLHAGDVITIVVSDTTVVYHAMLDNTVKIIQRA